MFFVGLQIGIGVAVVVFKELLEILGRIVVGGSDLGVAYESVVAPLLKGG